MKVGIILSLALVGTFAVAGGEHRVDAAHVLRVTATPGGTESTLLKFPAEVSAMLSSLDFPRALADARAKVPAGYELAITSAMFQRIGAQTYAYVNLEKKRVTMFPVVGFAFGSLVGEVAYSPEGEATVRSIYFSPAPELPRD